MNRRLATFFYATLAVAGLLLVLVDWHAMLRLEPGQYGALAVFIALATLSEHLATEAGTGRRVRSSVAFIPLLALTLVFPVGAVLLAVVVMNAGQAFRPTGKRIHVAFNTASAIIAYGVAGLIFHVFPATGSLEHAPDAILSLFFPFYAAVIAYFGLNVLLISGFIAIRDGQRLWSIVAEATGRGGGNFFYDLLASPVALFVAYLYWKLGIAGLLAVVLPLLLIRHSYLDALKLERTNRDLLRVLIKAIETRDPYTSGHSMRVSTLAQAIAEDLGVRGRMVNRIETAALLHDIGKIEALYVEIISKEGSLTAEERDVIQTHATKGADLLQTLTSMEKEVVTGVRHHHERYDGTGYPDQLCGKDIPLAARIIMICDAVDAMLSDRPYRNALPVAEVRQELIRCSGSQFDPDIVRAMLENNTLERAELLVDRSGARAPVRAVV